MNIYNFKQENINNKGITLIALIITIVLMLLIIGVSVNTGKESLDSTRLSGFYAQLELIQKRVDDIASNNESYIDSSGKVVYIKNQGVAYSKLSTILKTKLEKIIYNQGPDLGSKIGNFRYFDKVQLQNILGLMDVPYNVFIDFNTRTIIAEEGININGRTYNILKNETYFVEQDESKNVGNIFLRFGDPISYGKNSYKINVSPLSNVGDVATGTIKYKKIDTRYWETADGPEIIVEPETEYNVEYVDNNNNNAYYTIEVMFWSSGVPYVSIK